MPETQSTFILASTSSIRKKILEAAGIEFIARAPNIDESPIKTAHLGAGGAPIDLPLKLARGKAAAIVSTLSGEDGVLVLGADQIMEMDGQVFDKPGSRAEAHARLMDMRGKMHRLIGGVCLYSSAQPEAPIWTHVSVSKLWVRPFSASFLDQYLEAEGDDIFHCVGGYKFEGRGGQLFEKIDGDYFSILGLPLLPVLDALRRFGGVKP